MERRDRTVGSSKKKGNIHPRMQTLKPRCKRGGGKDNEERVSSRGEGVLLNPYTPSRSYFAL